MRPGQHCPSCSHSPVGREDPPALRHCRCLDCHGIQGSPASQWRGAGLAQTASVGMVCPAGGDQIPHYGNETAWFTLMLCGFRCWSCLRSKQILLLGLCCLYHRSLYTRVYFVLKLLAFLFVFQTDSAEMETSSFLF